MCTGPLLPERPRLPSCIWAQLAVSTNLGVLFGVLVWSTLRIRSLGSPGNSQKANMAAGRAPQSPCNGPYQPGLPSQHSPHMALYGSFQKLGGHYLDPGHCDPSHRDSLEGAPCFWKQPDPPNTTPSSPHMAQTSRAPCALRQRPFCWKGRENLAKPGQGTSAPRV